MSEQAQPLVSCLCVTEGRPAFMPWLVWCFDRQRWPVRELVIVDSSPLPFDPGGRADIRVVPAPPGMGVAAKRNMALGAAAGAIITWFDDDDWQHPDRLNMLVEALRGGAPYAGGTRSWFIDLERLTCGAYRAASGHILFNGAGFRRDVALPARFPEAIRRASDTSWMQQIADQHGRRVALVDRQPLFLWLCHSRNLSNPAGRRRCEAPLGQIRELCGPDGWGDTDDALEALRARLRAEAPPAPRRAPARAEHQAPLSSFNHGRGANDQIQQPAGPSSLIRGPVDNDVSQSSVAEPEVSLMIKATVLDAPYLDVMARHMVAQARYPFRERVIVVDSPVRFQGKYQGRPQAPPAALDEVLGRLLAEGVIDRVCPVDPAPATIQSVMARYFGRQGAHVPTHACTGGPIYATLYGIEALASDLVLQMDADVFFHTGAESWVRRALACLRADPSLWLMMAHPGPPAGPPGASLRGANAGLARWDAAHAIWRFRTATTRYFLCNRRSLHGRLQPIAQQGGCAPLEQCISQALQCHGACRGSLGDTASWHLHAWYHGEPFPAWAPQIVRAIEAGCYPPIQRGSYDLRLDRASDREAWAALLVLLFGSPLGVGPRTNDQGPSARRWSFVLGRWSEPDTDFRDAVLVSDDGPAAASDGRPTADDRHVVDPLASDVSGRSGQTPQGRRATVAIAQAGPPHDSAETAPLAVVVPVRDRAGRRLRNALESLAWQTAGRPRQTIVVSHGSQPAIDGELAALCADYGAALHTIGDPAEPWNKPLALNYGIRASDPATPYMMTMDGDMILAPNFLEVVLEQLARPEPTLVLCRSADLPAQAVLPAQPEQLLAAFPCLRELSTLRSRTGTGGIQAAARAFFFEIRGYDEDLRWWGAMDGDLVRRAQLLRLAIAWIDDRTTMLHQWHPRKADGLTEHQAITQARRAWVENHRIAQARAQIARRNPDGWGGGTDVPTGGTYMADHRPDDASCSVV